jgi:hypothetical protein
MRAAASSSITEPNVAALARRIDSTPRRRTRYQNTETQTP